jgi:hypothetical protein
MSAAALTLCELRARSYYLTWLVATHPALNAHDACTMQRCATSMNHQCAALAARLIGA